MKKLLLLVLFINVSFCLTAKESRNPNAPQRSEQGPDFEALNQLLELDEDQTVQLKALMDEHKTKRQQQKDEKQTERKIRRDEMKAQHEARKQEILNILSAEQFEKLETYMKQFRPPHKPERPNKPEE